MVRLGSPGKGAVKAKRRAQACLLCRADGTMQDVEHLMQDKYGGGERAWFEHPVRLTVKGVDPAAGGAASLGSGE